MSTRTHTRTAADERLMVLLGNLARQLAVYWLLVVARLLGDLARTIYRREHAAGGEIRPHPPMASTGHTVQVHVVGGINQPLVDLEAVRAQVKAQRRQRYRA